MRCTSSSVPWASTASHCLSCAGFCTSCCSLSPAERLLSSAPLQASTRNLSSSQLMSCLEPRSCHELSGVRSNTRTKPKLATTRRLPRSSATAMETPSQQQPGCCNSCVSSSTRMELRSSPKELSLQYATDALSRGRSLVWICLEHHSEAEPPRTPSRRTKQAAGWSRKYSGCFMAAPVLTSSLSIRVRGRSGDVTSSSERPTREALAATVTEYSIGSCGGSHSLY
mmetsp:Transcript_27534/g.53941  ORF Transcript_27534/g.53941 Transcript_27534/m.53941 type:complete len:226 (+) Transcript_27534:1321-1998(+)